MFPSIHWKHGTRFKIENSLPVRHPSPSIPLPSERRGKFGQRIDHDVERTRQCFGVRRPSGALGEADEFQRALVARMTKTACVISSAAWALPVWRNATE